LGRNLSGGRAHGRWHAFYGLAKARSASPGAVTVSGVDSPHPHAGRRMSSAGSPAPGHRFRSSVATGYCRWTTTKACCSGVHGKRAGSTGPPEQPQAATGTSPAFDNMMVVLTCLLAAPSPLPPTTRKNRGLVAVEVLLGAGAAYSSSRQNASFHGTTNFWGVSAVYHDEVNGRISCNPAGLTPFMPVG
jgi:hypothetical protein